MSERPWNRYLSDSDRAVLTRGGFGRRMGVGERPALLAIDCQRYMVGERGIDDGRYPSSCGETGWRAVDHICRLIEAARPSGIPIFFTRFTLDPSGSDIGVYGRKRDLLESPYWCLEGSPGAELLPEFGLQPGDMVLVKKKPSAFFGTPLLAYLIDRHIDTLVVCGGATSNCVQATVFDASSHNFRTIVPQEAVFDRLPISHAIGLFDMDRQFADVVGTDEVVDYFHTCSNGGRR